MPAIGKLCAEEVRVAFSLISPIFLAMLYFSSLYLKPKFNDVWVNFLLRSLDIPWFRNRSANEDMQQCLYA